jgi:hypothetical protein
VSPAVNVPLAILLANLAATLAMTGVIWTIQLVHYPLFGRVGEAGFAAYAAEHASRITLLVGPLMLVELATAAALVWWRPAALPGWAAVAGLALVALIWVSTWLVQVPLHEALGGGFDRAVYERLVATNWVRTAAWTARAALVLWAAARAID